MLKSPIQRWLYTWKHKSKSENQIYNTKQRTAKGRPTWINDTIIELGCYRFEKQPLIPVTGPAWIQFQKYQRKPIIATAKEFRHSNHNVRHIQNTSTRTTDNGETTKT